MSEQQIVFKVELTNTYGLHARPAALFVEMCNRFESQVSVRLDNEQVNGKNILDIMTLGAGPGRVLEIEVLGADAAQAATALRELVEGRFGED